MQLEIESGVLRIRTAYADKDRCAAVPGGRWAPSRKAWEYLLSPATAAAVIETFGSRIPSDQIPLLREMNDRLIRAKGFREGSVEPLVPRGVKKPWDHQKVAYSIVHEIFDFDHQYGGGSLMALDMGAGKSRVGVDIVTNNAEHIRKTLIVCPHSVIDVWPKEFTKHALPQDLQNILIASIKMKHNLEKKTRYAHQMLQQAEALKKQFVCVINYESAWREPFASWSQEMGFDLVVSDEIHRIKTASGKASKYFARLAYHTRYRLGLTGTPMPHSPLDIYGQYRHLDPGIFGTSYTKFRSEFANMGGFQNHQVLSFKNTDRLHDKMYLIAYRVMSDDVFDLPDKIDVERTADLNTEEARIYAEMNEQFCVEVDKNLVTADNALVKLLRLQEITSGFIDGQPIGTSKAALLADVLEDLAVKEPIVIFARFTNDLRKIREVVESQGRRYAELSGHTNDLAKWQDGHADVLGVQIKSGREGVDFTRARYCIYYSLGFSLGDYNQSRKRIHRPGQTRNCTYIHLIMNKTVDEKVIKALEKREEVVSSVLQQYREEVESGEKRSGSRE